MTTNHPISTRILSLFTIIILLFGLVGCNSGSNSTDNATKNKDYAKDTFNSYYSVKDSDLVINKDTEKWGELKCGECTYYEFDSYSANSTEKNLFHNVMIIRTSDKAMSWFLYDDNDFSTYMLKNNLDIDSHSEKHNNLDVSSGENNTDSTVDNNDNTSQETDTTKNNADSTENVDFNVNVDERILVSGTIMSTGNLTIDIGKYCLQLEEPITIKLNDPYFADSSKIYECSILYFYDDTELIDSSENSYYLTDDDIGKKCSIFARVEDYRDGGDLYFLYPEIWFD